MPYEWYQQNPDNYEQETTITVTLTHRSSWSATDLRALRRELLTVCRSGRFGSFIDITISDDAGLYHKPY
jgi:hypothetical protein